MGLYDDTQLAAMVEAGAGDRLTAINAMVAGMIEEHCGAHWSDIEDTAQAKMVQVAVARVLLADNGFRETSVGDARLSPRSPRFEIPRLLALLPVPPSYTTTEE